MNDCDKILPYSESGSVDHELKCQLTLMNKSLCDLRDRMQALELKSQTSPSRRHNDHVDPSPYQTPNLFSIIKDYGHRKALPVPIPQGTQPRPMVKEFAEIQDLFNCIKASVEKVI